MARKARKLARLQRKLDRQRRANNPECFDEKGRWKKGKRANKTSKRMLKTEAQIRSAHAQVANQRKDAYYKLATKLLSEFDTVYLGDWKDETPKVRQVKKAKAKKEGAEPRAKGQAMLEKMANRMDRENALGLFRQILQEKVARSGGFKALVMVPEAYTTQKCAKCGAPTGPTGYKQGWWTCSACEHRQLRGRTAAYNILQRGKELQLENESSIAPDGQGSQMSPAREKGVGQALKGDGNPIAVGRMPQGEGASASAPARRNRKASAPSAHRADGLSAPARAKSSVSLLEDRGTAGSTSSPTEPGKAARPTAGTALAGIRENQPS